MIPSLTFLSPAWLAAGAGAALLPVLAHLLSLRRPRRVEFPAARFVRAALLAATRRTRPRDGLLLALRILAILLIACAFADPVLTPRGLEAEAATERAEDTVIIIDASASMQRLRGGVPLFEHARAEALAILRRLDPSRDRAAVALAAGRPRLLLPRLTGNFSALAGELSAARPTLEFGDAQAALEAAASLLSPTTERPGRIVILSDFQTSQWSGARVDLPIDARPILPDGADLGMSTDAISLSRAPHERSAGARFLVTITNHDRVERSIPVTLSSPLGGSAALVSVGPEGTATATLDLAPTAPELSSVRISIPSDAFPFDDSRYALLDTRMTPGAAVISASDVSDLSRGAAWVYAALAARSGGKTTDAVTQLQPRALAGPDLLRFEAVALVECGAMDDASVEAILERLRGGGDVIWFLDSEDSRGSLDRLLRRAGVASESAESALQPTTELMIAAFLGADIPVDWLSSAVIDAPASLPSIEAGEQIATLSDGSPFIVRVHVGAASLALVRADLSPAASTLAASGLLPAILDALIRSAKPAWAEMRSGLVGEPLVVAIDGAAASALPAHPRDSLGRDVELEARGDVTLAHFDPLPAPGVVSLADASGSPVVMQAVNIDARESEPARLADRALQTLSGSVARIGDEEVRTADGIRPDAERSDRAIELWPIAMALALALLTAESCMLWLMRRSAAPNGEAAP